MPIEFMVISEEIQEKMKGLYHRYQALQRDGSVSIKPNEAQILLEIHKARFNTNFCTTCQDAILKALEMCFRDYEYIVPRPIESDSEIKELSEAFDKHLTEEFGVNDLAKDSVTPKKYVFSGTNKQWKQVKQAWPDFKKTDILQQGDRTLTLVIANSWISWFKEV